MNLRVVVSVLFCLVEIIHSDLIINLDASGGRTFEGIGAISGGGATSKLLVRYNEKEMKEILEYLFKPGYAASLHQFKVEIGGDSQSTEGTEASHMHDPEDLDCTRGYEGYLMAEAKKINPNLELHGLPWTFPGWLGVNQNPFVRPNDTAHYVLNWIKCMKTAYNVQINYIGIWNEHFYSADYIKTLRRVLDANNETGVKIIANDDNWSIADHMAKDAELAKAIYAIGAHYPGTLSSHAAQKLGKPLWASEDYSTYNDEIGSGCWARILNQNYVNGFMTSTIAWNLVASYFDQLPFPKCSLMTANEPWSGHYMLNGPVWITAHTTQFTKPGWKYLEHGAGVGHLPNGGSYVSLVSPDRKDLTIVIETMTHEHSACIRPPLPKYSVKPQNITLHFVGKVMENIKHLHVWATQLRFGPKQVSDHFVYLGRQNITDNKINLMLGLDQLITLSTVEGHHAEAKEIAPSKPLSLPYKDDFQLKLPARIREPEYLTPQVGYFELVPDPESDNQLTTILEQVAPERTLDWCQIGFVPIALMGYESNWKNVEVVTVGRITNNSRARSIFVAGRVQHGGCVGQQFNGVFGWLDIADQKYRITLDSVGNHVLASGSVQTRPDTWYELKLVLKENQATLLLNNRTLAVAVDIQFNRQGFVGLGCGAYGKAQYKQFSVNYV